MLYEKSDEILKGLYKSASFVVQAIVFQQTGQYVRKQTDLSGVVTDDEKTILEIFATLKNGGKVDFDTMSQVLFNWSKQWIVKGK
jgi:hypothetical protein